MGRRTRNGHTQPPVTLPPSYGDRAAPPTPDTAAVFPPQAVAVSPVGVVEPKGLVKAGGCSPNGKNYLFGTLFFMFDDGLWWCRENTSVAKSLKRLTSHKYA